MWTPVIATGNRQVNRLARPCIQKMDARLDCHASVGWQYERLLQRWITFVQRRKGQVWLCAPWWFEHFRGKTQERSRTSLEGSLVPARPSKQQIHRSVKPWWDANIRCHRVVYLLWRRCRSPRYPVLASYWCPCESILQQCPNMSTGFVTVHHPHQRWRGDAPDGSLRAQSFSAAGDCWKHRLAHWSKHAVKSETAWNARCRRGLYLVVLATAPVTPNVWRVANTGPFGGGCERQRRMSTSCSPSERDDNGIWMELRGRAEFFSPEVWWFRGTCDPFVSLISGYRHEKQHSCMHVRLPPASVRRVKPVRLRPVCWGSARALERTSLAVVAGELPCWCACSALLTIVQCCLNNNVLLIDFSVNPIITNLLM